MLLVSLNLLLISLSVHVETIFYTAFKSPPPPPPHPTPKI